MNSAADPHGELDGGLLQAPPLGLYVHFPWCVRKCPYCDFNSHRVRDEISTAQYLGALLNDLDRDLPLAGGRVVSSVYFGGGTPSLFSAADFDCLIREFRSRLDLPPDAEISLEANPGTVEHDSFTAYRQAGINRVSLGVQSFDDALLGKIGRIHGSAEVDRAVASLQTAGLANFNIDLMFGLPGQTGEQAAGDVAAAVAAGPAHISHYQLTVEPNTAFAANPPKLPAEEACWSMQDGARELLENAGYRQYEISAWSQPAQECRHNLNYWRYGDFLGIGAGAHAKLTDPATGDIRRMAKQRHPKAYLSDPERIEDCILGPDDRVFEFFLNSLRLREGVSPRDFSARTGLPWTRVSESIGRALERGLLAQRGQRFVPTDLGWRFVNDIQAMFLP